MCGFSEKFLCNVLGKIPRFLFPLVFFLSLVMRIRGSSWGVSPQQESLESYFWLPWVFNHWKKCNHLVWYNLVYDTIPLLKRGREGGPPPNKKGRPLSPTYGQVWLSAMKQQMSLYHRFDTIFMYDWFVVKIILGTRTSSLQKNEQFQIKKKGGRI